MSQEIYTTNSEAFRVYLNHVDQKAVLIDHIKKKLVPAVQANQKFVFTDIGGGEGSITLGVTDFLRKQADLEVSYIDNSQELARAFQEKNTYRKVNVMTEDVENVTLPSSDFILAAHVLKYVDEQDRVVQSIINSLNPGGTALIVDTDEESDDVRLRSALGLPLVGGQVGEGVISKLSKDNVPFKHEVVESKIDFSKTLNLDKEGKALMSFFYHRSFNDISKNEVDKFQQALKKLSKNGKIVKREDYIWVRLPL